MKLKIDFDIAERTLNSQWPSFYMLGSCFAQNQAQRMNELGLAVSANPFGISYNPFSIEQTLRRIADNIQYKTSDFEQQKACFSWEHHGDFSYASVKEAVSSSNEILSKASKRIKQSDVVVITLGTSLVYIRQKTIVANCHKQPNSEFEQLQQSFEDVRASIKNIVSHIRDLNKHTHIIFTVSPIRHLRSGVMKSSRSKATLITALREVLDSSDNTSYFPSYEIFMDELRDYRFAKLDMTHPTSQAEQYIWDRFCQTYFSKETISILKDVEKFNGFSNHRPHDATLHADQVKKRKTALIKKHPFVKL